MVPTAVDLMRDRDEAERLTTAEERVPTFSSPALPRSNRFAELQKKLKAKDAEAKKAIENMH